MSDKQSCNCKFTSAVDHAMHDLQKMAGNLQIEMHQLPWYAYKRKLVGRAMFESFVIVLSLLETLRLKYDNSHGSFN